MAGPRADISFLSSFRVLLLSAFPVASHKPGGLRVVRWEGDRMPKHDVDALYRRIDAANKRHLREFDRYTRMLTSGFRSGRFYSEQELAAQLAKADEAMAEGQAAEAAFHEAMNGEGPADN